MVPFDKPVQQKFMARNYLQRNHVLKQRLLLEGKVRAKEGEYDAVAMIVPVKKTIDEWIEQSRQLGQTLKEKERAHSYHTSGVGGLRHNPHTVELQEKYGSVMELSQDTL